MQERYCVRVKCAEYNSAAISLELAQMIAVCLILLRFWPKFNENLAPSCEIWARKCFLSTHPRWLGVRFDSRWKIGYCGLYYILQGLSSPRHSKLLKTRPMITFFRLPIMAMAIFLVFSGRVVNANPQSGIGPGVWADSLGNIRVGSTNKEISLRFKSKNEGRLLSFRTYWQYGKRPGYHNGNGGDIRITLMKNGKFNTPGSKVLARTSFIPRLSLKNPGSKDIRFDVIKFPTAPTLRKGGLYHIVFKNVTKDPRANWISLNALFSRRAGYDLFAPKFNPLDWRYLALPVGRTSWDELDQFLPIFELEFDTNNDGIGDAYQGMGYMEIWRSQFSYVEGKSQIRERFSMTSDQRVKSLWVVATRLAGASPLVATLNGTTPEQQSSVEFPASLFLDPKPTGVRKKLLKRLTLIAGEQYTLALSTKPGTQYAVEVVRDGAATNYGFTPGSTFSTGTIEKSVDGGISWNGWDYWGQKNRADGDLAFELY